MLTSSQVNVAAALQVTHARNVQGAPATETDLPDLRHFLLHRGAGKCIASSG
jgi:hypothetical protein